MSVRLCEGDLGESEVISKSTIKRLWEQTRTVEEFAREIERRTLERAAALIAPKNEPDDWTDWARVRYEAACQIRSLIEPTRKEPK